MTTAEPTNPIRSSREAGGEAPPRRSALNVVLWVLQVLLGLLFLWAGGMKLVMPLEKLAGPVDLPGWFVRFIGVVELLGGLGLILPGLLRIRPGLTVWAAAGLVIVMIGAVGITLAGGGETAAMAVIPAVTGLLAAFIAYGRWRLVPLRSKK
ncbi:MAG TPA: DoxX family protein [Thermoanaerobaculia bacterium]|nr:DoxX family protein [Thermoanaerobaculia bacterium]